MIAFQRGAAERPSRARRGTRRGRAGPSRSASVGVGGQVGRAPRPGPSTSPRRTVRPQSAWRIVSADSQWSGPTKSGGAARGHRAVELARDDDAGHLRAASRSGGRRPARARRAAARAGSSRAAGCCRAPRPPSPRGPRPAAGRRRRRGRRCRSRSRSRRAASRNSSNAVGQAEVARVHRDELVRQPERARGAGARRGAAGRSRRGGSRRGSSTSRSRRTRFAAIRSAMYGPSTTTLSAWR